MPSLVLDGIQVFGILLGQGFPLLVTGQFIRQPHVAGIESGAPVIDGNVDDVAILVNGTRVQNLSRFLNNVRLQSFLGYGVVNVFLDYLIPFNLFYYSNIVNEKTKVY